MLAAAIDHTLLKPTATEEQIRVLCAEALEYNFASVCVQPCWVALCAKLLEDSPVKVCTVIGFPLGVTLSGVKACEAMHCLALGATELDMVINLGALKSRQLELVKADIAEVVDVAHPRGALVKVIIETGYLSEEEKITACNLAKAAGADFVKTSTGFGPGGATVEDVTLMRTVVGPEVGVKASGGVKTAAEARAMLAAGATRIGTSAGVRIASEEQG